MAENAKKTAVTANATAQTSVVEKKPFGVSPGGMLWLAALGSSLLALLVYGCTLAQYLYPGESAALFTQWMGLESLHLPLHPV